MKTANFLRVVLVTGLLAAAAGAFAQGRSNNRSDSHAHNDRGHRDAHMRRDSHRDVHRSDPHARHDYHYRDDRYDHHHHGRVPARDVHVHHYHRPAPAPRRVVYHYHQPRYVYYRDYDVYYDYDRNVYIMFSGGHWMASNVMPVCLHRVDVVRANRVTVEYYDDDFPYYLEQRRPGGRLYASW